MKTSLYSFDNTTPSGDIDLNDAIFSTGWRPELVKQVLVAQRANARRPWAHTKDRSEVRGGGKKPWQQKGTGRARHGSTRSPIWKGGGVTFGPRKEKIYTQKINKKMRKQALSSVLSKRLADEELRIVENIAIKEAKTKVMFAALDKFLGRNHKKMDVLIIRNPENEEITRSARNLVKTKVVSPVSLNVYDLLNYKTILVDKEALPIINEYLTL